MDEILKELQKWIQRVKDLENSFKNIRILSFPADTGKLQVPIYTTDPTDAVDGDIWYNSTSNKYKGKENGVIKTFTTT